jgi:hypothetical protein
MKLTQIELEHLRHLVGGHELAAKKYGFYAEQCQDPELKEKFLQAADGAQNNYQKLLTFLN